MTAPFTSATPTAALAGLHDATLLRVQMDWAEGLVRLVLRRGPGESGLVSLRCDAVHHLEVPREHPWGASVSVNELRWMADFDAAGGRLEVEVQSGDVIAVGCKDFGIEATATAT